MATSSGFVGAPEPFDLSKGADWKLYTQRFEHFVKANKVEDDQKKHLLLALVGAPTYKLLANLAAPTEPGDLSYKDVVDKLDAHFKPKPVIIAERFRFYKRIQESGEKVADYLAELRRLAATCEFKTFLGEALRDKFVCGLSSEGIQRRLLVEASLTLEKAFELAQGMESAAADAKQFHAKETGVASGHVQKVNTPQRKPNQSICHKYLGRNHSSENCRYKAFRCNKCRKIGHIARACKSESCSTPTSRGQSNHATRRRRPHQTHRVDGAEESQTESDPEFNDVVSRVHAVGVSVPKSYKVNLEMNGIQLTMELDTGAGVSLVSEKTWVEELGKPELSSIDLPLEGYPNRPLRVLGQCHVDVKVHGKEAMLPLIVVEGDGISLFGRNWLQSLKLNWMEIAKINSVTKNHFENKRELENLLAEYQEIFGTDLGKCKGVKAHLYVKPDAKPKFYRPRPIPLALKDKIEADLDRMVKLEIIEKVDTSEWASPTVPVMKADGSVRHCGDYKVTINPHLDVNQHPLPKPDELFATLNGGQHFTKLDLSEAYLQIELEDESKQFLVINTHKGLYRFNRLPYGVASAPAIFQKVMDQVLQGLPGIACYIDDILVTGRTDEEHMRNLKAVFKRLKEHGFRLKMRKCQFFRESVEYLGKIISSEGLHTSPTKVEAILKVAPPTDVSQLRSFLGMVNHYGRFIKCLADLSAPLNRLLRKDEPWSWNTECQDSFVKIKEALTTTTVLAHFSPELPLGIACDASAVGIGAVLFHRYPDGSERPIAYASKSLTKAEKNYSQIEREALSIIFGVRKFHQFLYGRSFILVTDHKPLLTIFGPKKGIPVMSASRLQRWAIILSAYTYSIEYKPTRQHGNADCLSRLPLDTDPVFEKYQSLHPVVNVIQQNQLTQLPVSAEEVKNATEKDPVLKQVIARIKGGWPKTQKNLPPELHPFFNRRFQLTIQEGCILCGLKVVIPSALKERVLEEIHEGHTGIVKMKSIARIHVWWPKIDVDIERTVSKCTACQETSRDPVRAPLHPWEQPAVEENPRRFCWSF